jgi:hypothetical protein
VPGERHVEARGRVRRARDGDPDERFAFDHRLVRRDNDDRPALFLAVPLDSNPHDLTVEGASHDEGSPSWSVVLVIP